MTSQKIDQLTLDSTLNGSILRDSLAKFRAFLRERDDNDEDEVKLDSEQELDFVLRVKDIGQGKEPNACPAGFYQGLAEDFFNARKYKINLRNATVRSTLESDLKVPDGKKVRGRGYANFEIVNIGCCLQESLNKLLQEPLKEVRERVVGYHEEWIQELLRKKVLQDRSGETFFTGWMA